MSTKTKRMSAEEKRNAILGVYHSTKEVYTEKEIIALAAKAGVNQNTWVVFCVIYVVVGSAQYSKLNDDDDNSVSSICIDGGVWI